LDTVGSRIKILLMEDDRDLGETLLDILEAEGYDVTLVYDGVEASEVSYQEDFDLYVLDINVPTFSGIDLLRALREAEDQTPTIFISALVDIETMTEAFKIGAEDYIKKPFFPEELLLRINRRFSTQHSVLSHGDLLYYPHRKELYRGDERIHLSRGQRELFDFFIQNRGRDLTKEEIFEATSIGSIASLRVAITKLKQQTGLVIENLHGIGYRIEVG